MNPHTICNAIDDSAFVEITAKIYNIENEYIDLEVISFRLLDPDETIHSPLYPMYHKILELEY